LASNKFKKEKMKENLKIEPDGELSGGPRSGEYGSKLSTELTPGQSQKTDRRGKKLLAHLSGMTESSFLDPETLMSHLERAAEEIKSGAPIEQCQTAQMILGHTDAYMNKWTELLGKGAADASNPEHVRYRQALGNLQYIAG
jgi:hypothetical protein